LALSVFVALADGVEVSGQHILSMVNCLGNHREKAVLILEEHGITGLEPRKWYSQQTWLDCFKLIVAPFHRNTLTLLGRKITENAIFPPEINVIGLALQSIDWAYHLHHRLDGVVMMDYVSGKMHEGIGHYYFEETAPNKAVIICNDPYPCDYDRGIIDSIAFRFRPNGSHPKVTHDSADHCRNNGGDFCTYIVEW
jgi:hypothetical protein